MLLDIGTSNVDFFPLSLSHMVTVIFRLFQVFGGPTIHLCLQATVTIPSMTLSCNKIEFATIHCGQFMVETIQLSNNLQVPCEWFVHTPKTTNKVNRVPLLSIPTSARVGTLGLSSHQFSFPLNDSQCQPLARP